MDLPPLRDFAVITAAVVAVFTFLVTFGKGVLEYTEQGTQKRAQQFLEMRRRLKEKPHFSKICALLNKGDDPALADVAIEDKLNFLGFFEELALMMNSGLIRPNVVHYMFGSFAIECHDNKHFWANLQDNRDGPYWSLFRDFVSQMREQEKQFRYERRDFYL